MLLHVAIKKQGWQPRVMGRDVLLDLVFGSTQTWPEPETGWKFQPKPDLCITWSNPNWPKIYLKLFFYYIKLLKYIKKYKQ